MEQGTARQRPGAVGGCTRAPARYLSSARRVGALWLWVSLTLALGTATSGCGPGAEEHSGEDAMRGGAAELPLNQPSDDRVSASGGDSTDWKVFELPQASNVTVDVWWDNPTASVGLRLRGMGGGQARTLKHARGVRHESLGPIDLPAGKWFLQIEARSGASVYTLQVTTGASSGGGAVPDF